MREDLHITGMQRNHRLAQAISDAGWATLARILTYQQTWRGGQVVVADRWFASSKTCSRCARIATTLPLSARTFRCAGCGLVRDRDLNAAVNLATWAEQRCARVRDPPAGGPVTNAHPGGRPRPAPACGPHRPP